MKRKGGGKRKEAVLFFCGGISNGGFGNKRRKIGKKKKTPERSTAVQGKKREGRTGSLPSLSTESRRKKKCRCGRNATGRETIKDPEVFADATIPHTSGKGKVGKGV